MNRRFRIVSILAACATLALFASVPPGCESDSSVAAEREAAVRERQRLDDGAAAALNAAETAAAKKAELERQRAELDALAKSLEVGSEARTSTEKAVASMTERIGAIANTIGEANAAASEARARSDELRSRIEKADAILADPGGQGEQLGGVLGELIPGAAVIAPILGGMAWRMFRLSRAKDVLAKSDSTKTTAIERIVASIDTLAKVAPEVREAIRRHKEAIDAVQGPVGKLAVDVAQTKAPPTALN